MERIEFIKILKRLQDKDNKALEQLYKEYYAKIYEVALSELKNRDDAYDIAMNVILELCDYRGNLEQIKNPTGLIIAITHHDIKDHFRRRKFYYDMNIQTIQKGVEVDDGLWIVDVMQVLTEEEREIFLDHLVWGKKLKDIAKEWRKPYITIKRIYSKIKEKIRKLYK